MTGGSPNPFAEHALPATVEAVRLPRHLASRTGVARRLLADSAHQSSSDVLSVSNCGVSPSGATSPVSAFHVSEDRGRTRKRPISLSSCQPSERADGVDTNLSTPHHKFEKASMVVQSSVRRSQRILCSLVSTKGKVIAEEKAHVSNQTRGEGSVRSDNRAGGQQVLATKRLQLKPARKDVLETEPLEKWKEVYLGFKAQVLQQEFFNRSAVELAPHLLGKLLRKDDVTLQITEVEAYTEGDTACHARFGNTARTAPLFGKGGHAYVYLCYGLHQMLNISCDREGTGAACLIRACRPVEGLETIKQRRKMEAEGLILLTGPGKVGQALGLTSTWSHHPLYEPGGLEILEGPPLSEGILVGPRVGIDYAERKDVEAPWRYAMAGTKWISAPRNTLEPL